tara:strand:- start:1617 stop:2102 length:486 start_codon:yes stop_codon:yes gene_type:complete
MDKDKTVSAEDWGRLAISLPGWPWMAGMRSEINTDTRRAAYRWLAGPSDDRHYGHVVIVEDKHGHACRTLATLQPGPDDLPDPDDPATAGCLLELLGPRCLVRILPREGRALCEIVIPSGLTLDGRPLRINGHTLGRACIAAAAALGRWPNVAEYGPKGAE